MSDISNYNIIIIDSDNAIYTNGSNNLHYYIKLEDNIKDVYKIKILYNAVSIPTANLKGSAPFLTKNLDTIYVNINDYDRIKSNYIAPDNSIITLKSFDAIIIDVNKIKTIDGITTTTMCNDFNENEGNYYLQPIESNFDRIEIKLVNKKNEVITKDFISRVVIKLCVYYNTKKISQF